MLKWRGSFFKHLYCLISISRHKEWAQCSHGESLSALEGVLSRTTSWVPRGRHEMGDSWWSHWWSSDSGDVLERGRPLHSTVYWTSVHCEYFPNLMTWRVSRNPVSKGKWKPSANKIRTQEVVSKYTLHCTGNVLESIKFRFIGKFTIPTNFTISKFFIFILMLLRLRYT